MYIRVLVAGHCPALTGKQWGILIDLSVLRLVSRILCELIYLLYFCVLGDISVYWGWELLYYFMYSVLAQVIVLLIYVLGPGQLYELPYVY